MNRHAPDWRLFVAIYPPPEVAADLLAAIDRLSPGPLGRVSVARVHLTLQFIGERPEREIQAVRESIARAAAGVSAFELRPIRLTTLPAGPRSRLIAAETDSPAPLLELHRRLALRLARNPRERDRFLPHLTLHRFKSTSVPVDLPLGSPAFAVTHILLMRSILRPEGAHHAEVSRFPLAT